MLRRQGLAGIACLMLLGFSVWLLTHTTATDAHPQVSKLEKITKSGKAAICIWPEYYAISYKNPKTGELEIGRASCRERVLAGV